MMIGDTDSKLHILGRLECLREQKYRGEQSCRVPHSDSVIRLAQGWLTMRDVDLMVACDRQALLIVRVW
jgi:hypothetical protein